MNKICDLPVIDPHIHLFDVEKTPRTVTPLYKLFGWNKKVYEKVVGWLTPKKAKLFLGDYRHHIYSYTLDDLIKDTSQINLQGVVHIQIDWQGGKLGSAGETKWLETGGFSSVSNTKFKLGAIIGHADLADCENLEKILDEHQSASSRFVGIREPLAWSTDPMVWSAAGKPFLMENDSWQRGIEVLGKRDLLFEAWVYDSQLPELTRLANEHSKTKIVLCHSGTPIGLFGPYASFGQTAGERQKIFESWKSNIAKLAKCDNVVVKISGLFLPVLGWGLHENRNKFSDKKIIEMVTPVVKFLISEFGADRCMFASNYPLEKASIEYGRLFWIYRNACNGMDKSDQEKLFRLTAKSVYKID